MLIYNKLDYRKFLNFSASSTTGIKSLVLILGVNASKEEAKVRKSGFFRSVPNTLGYSFLDAF